MGPFFGRGQGYGPSNQYSAYQGVGFTDRASSNSQMGDPSTGFASFIGKVVDEGPDGAEDYTDARYWVKELIEASPADPLPKNTDRPKFEPLELKLQDNVRFAGFKPKLITATNLSEYNVSEDDGSADTHDVEVDGSVVVHCHLIRGRGGVERWLFTHGGKGGGGEQAYVVVREVFAAPSLNVRVQKVVYDLEADPVVIKTVGGTFMAHCKPGIVSSQYLLWQWQTQIHQTQTRYLKIDKVGGLWILTREPDLMTDRLPLGVRWSDCKPAATTR